MGKRILNIYGVSSKDLNGKMGIYVVTNILNGKQYVGQSHNILRRWYDHRFKSMHPNKVCDYNSKFYQAIRKDGLENFHIKILELCEENRLDEREQFWIKKLDTYNNGYNNDHGGNAACVTKEHHLTDHGKAKLTIGEVKMCRAAYQRGERSRDIYDKYFSNKMEYSGFLRMWHGKTWKEIMPEVFLGNPNPKRKATNEQIIDIRKRFDSGEKIKHIAEYYKGKLGYATVYAIAHRQRYTEKCFEGDVSTSS